MGVKGAYRIEGFHRNDSRRVPVGFRYVEIVQNHSWVTFLCVDMNCHSHNALNRHEKSNRNAVAVTWFGRFSKKFRRGTRSACLEVAKVFHVHSPQGNGGASGDEDAYYAGLRWGDTAGATSENGASTQQVPGPL